MYAAASSTFSPPYSSAARRWDRSGTIADGRYPQPARGDAPASHFIIRKAGERRPRCGDLHRCLAALSTARRVPGVKEDEGARDGRKGWNESGRQRVVLLLVHSAYSAPGPCNGPCAPKAPSGGRPPADYSPQTTEPRDPVQCSDLIVAATRPPCFLSQCSWRHSTAT